MSGADAVALLRALTDAEPIGIWSAPGRVNLIGEHTDYNEGFVLPFAIGQRTSAAVASRQDDRIRVASTLADAPIELPLRDLSRELFASEAVPTWAAYPLGVAWALHASGASGPGVDIAISSDVPLGAGLSSSAAIECAVALALNDLWGAGLDRRALAQIGRRAENEVVGAPTGIMDQMASIHGEADAALFIDCRTLDAQIVPLGFAEQGLSLLVVDTRVKHSHATGGYGDRRAACERGARALGVEALRDAAAADLDRATGLLDDETFRRVRHVVTENRRVRETVQMLRTQGPRGIGPFLTASHLSLRDDFEVSTPELDTAVDAALAAGALGARMTGGGFGGAAIALVDTTAVEKASDAVRAAFAASGFTEPGIFTVTPSAGARREETDSAR